MAVYIDAILFNLDPTVGSGAINLRLDALHSVTLPEWRPGLPVPADAPAVYSLADIHRDRLVIQARFRRDSDEESIWMEAQDGSEFRTNTLGSISRFRIDFHDNNERVITIPISYPRVSAVSLHDDVWNWTYVDRHRERHFAGKSRHRIYTILAKPGPPWNPDAGNSYLWPWREIVDLACRWACGAATKDAAARKIGEAIMRLGEFDGGKRQLRYDIRDTYNSFARDPFFDCIEFLRMVKGKPYAIHKVDCSDFASMISTVANVLGCELKTVVLRTRATPPSFQTNSVQAVGRPDFEDPFHFTYHEVAFSGDTGPDGTVWDSCFFVDGDSDPTTAPHTATAPLGLPLGRPGALQYLDRLVHPKFRPLMTVNVEQPNRSVTPMIESAGGRSSRTIPDFRDDACAKVPDEEVFIFKFFLAGIRFKGWTLRRLILPRLANGDTSIDSFWECDHNENVLVRVQIDIEPTSSDARHNSLTTLAASAIPIIRMPMDNKQLRFPVIGTDHVIIVDTIGNLAIEMRNVGFEDEILDNFFAQITTLLTNQCEIGGECECILLPPPVNSFLRIELRDTSGFVWFKLFTTTGRLFSQGDVVFYSPNDHTATHVIRVYEMNGMTCCDRYYYRYDLPQQEIIRQ